MSLWFLPLCLIAGIALSLFLYRKNTSDSDLSASWRNTLIVLRASYLSILFFLLLSPFLRSAIPHFEKPLIIIAEDASRSVMKLSDSTALIKFKEELNSSIDAFDDDFEVQRFAFGETLRKESDHQFRDQSSDLTMALNEIEERFKGRNVAFMLFSSDGNYNKGSNPMYRNTSRPFPIHTILLGDTSLKADARLLKVFHNDIAFVNNSFDIEVAVSADLLKGERSEIRIERSGEILAKKEISYKDDRFSDKVSFELQAERIGQERFDVILTPIEGEQNRENNMRSFFVEVLEGQQKILLLAQSPHPDIAAIQSSINSARTYEIKTFLLSEFQGDINDFDLVILHQISNSITNKRIEELLRSDIPLFMIMGLQSDMKSLGQMGLGVRVNKFRNQFVDASPELNESFQLFSIDRGDRDLIDQFPPLKAPLCNYDISPNFEALFEQNVRNVSTGFPLIGFGEQNGRRFGMLFGDGLWRWKLFNHQLRQNHDFFDEMLQKIVQYLASKEDRSRFRVHMQPSYFEREEVEIEAEYYDKAFELNTAFPCSFELIDESGERFDYEFIPAEQGYRLSLGKLPEGNYRWQASLNDGSEVHQRKGSFTVKPLQIENTVSRANAELMRNLAAENGGQMMFANQLPIFLDSALNSGTYKSLMHTEEKEQSLISFTMLFYLLLALVSIEWFLRKWKGLL